MIFGARTRPKKGPDFRLSWLLLLNTRRFAHCGGDVWLCCVVVMCDRVSVEGRIWLKKPEGRCGFPNCRTEPHLKRNELAVWGMCVAGISLEPMSASLACDVSSRMTL